MTLRQRARVARVLIWILPFCAIGVAAVALRGSLYLLLPIGAFILAPFCLGRVAWWSTNVLVRRAYGLFDRAVEEGRFDVAHQVVDELRVIHAGSALGNEFTCMLAANVLAREERYREAIVLLESLDRKRLGAVYLPDLLNNLAWSHAQAGNGARAVVLAHESLEASAQCDAIGGTARDLRAYQLGTLGTALLVAGQPKEAIPPLEQALARGGSAWAQSVRAFYLGEALHASGLHQDAELAWMRASSEDPSGNYSRRAEDRLREARNQSPYRR